MTKDKFYKKMTELFFEFDILRCANIDYDMLRKDKTTIFSRVCLMVNNDTFNNWVQETKHFTHEEDNITVLIKEPRIRHDNGSLQIETWINTKSNGLKIHICLIIVNDSGLSSPYISNIN